MTHRFHWMEYGAGEPLVILHGLFGSLDNWATLARRFGERHHVLAYDARNHGRSFHDPVFSYRAMAEDLREFMAARGIASANLLGHSMGGKTCMTFAVSYPAKVRRLVVVDIGPKEYGRRHDELLEAMHELDPAAFRDRSAVDAALGVRIADAPVRQFLMKNLVREPHGGFRWKMNLPVIAARYAETGRPLPAGARYDGPTLFVRGSLSSYLLPGDFPSIRGFFPAAEMATVEGAGHWVHADRPAELAAVVEEFLGGGGEPAPPTAAS